MIAAVIALIGGRGIAIIAAALAGIALVVGVYQSGANAERKRGEAARLRQTIATMERQRDAALDIQTRMAASMAALRADQMELEKQSDALIDNIRAEPAVGACNLSSSSRMRLQSIRIGRSRANSTAR